jgi:hypothetical protein
MTAVTSLLLLKFLSLTGLAGVKLALKPVF